MTASVWIDAPVASVYRCAAEPGNVPRYAEEIDRIEIIDRLDATRATARSTLRLGPCRWTSTYHYRYHAPRTYAGAGVRGRARGFFAMTFEPARGGTRVVHTEGVTSRLPGLAPAVGCLYFGLLGKSHLHDELGRLKQLAETGPGEGHTPGAPAR